MWIGNVQANKHTTVPKDPGNDSKSWILPKRKFIAAEMKFLRKIKGMRELEI